MTRTTKLAALAAVLVVSAATVAALSGSAQESVYEKLTERDYSKHSIKRGQTLKTRCGSWTETLAYFDTEKPRLEDSRGKPILLLHGFTANKETWLKMVEPLGHEHRLVAVDLAGHGESPGAPDGRYTVRRQAERAHCAATHLELNLKENGYHVLGHSMGGAVAIEFAVAHSDEVRSLGLIASAGAAGQHTDRFHEKLDQGINPLIVASNWSGGRKLRYVTDSPLWTLLSLLANSFLTKDGLEKSELNTTIFGQLKEGDNLSYADLDSINRPTFILWGTEDRVLEPFWAGYCDARGSGALCRLSELKGVGHTPILEKPGKTATAYLDFLNSLPHSEFR